MEKGQSLQQLMWKQLHIHMEKRNKNQNQKKFDFYRIQKIDISIKSKTIKLLEENMEEIFVTLG